MATFDSSNQEHIDTLTDSSKPGVFTKAAIYSFSSPPKVLASTSSFNPSGPEIKAVYTIFSGESPSNQTERRLAIEGDEYAVAGDIDSETVTIDALSVVKDDATLKQRFLAKKAGDVMVLGICSQLEEGTVDRFAEVARKIDLQSLRDG